MVQISIPVVPESRIQIGILLPVFCHVDQAVHIPAFAKSIGNKVIPECFPVIAKDFLQITVCIRVIVLVKNILQRRRIYLQASAQKHPSRQTDHSNASCLTNRFSPSFAHLNSSFFTRLKKA